MHGNFDHQDVRHPLLKRTTGHDQIMAAAGSAGDRLSVNLQVSAGSGSAMPTDAGRFDGLGTGIAQQKSTHGFSDDYPYAWSM